MHIHTLARAREPVSSREGRVSPALVGHEYYASAYI